MTGRRSTSFSALLLAFLGVLAVSVGASPSAADDCVALGGTPSGGQCQITGTVSRSGSYAISTGLRITSTGSIVVPSPGPGAGSSLSLIVAGGVNLEAPALGQAAIDGNAGGVAAIGATVTIVAGGNIVMDGAGSVGAQIRTSGNTSSASGCSATAPPSPIWGRAGDITLTSTTGHITLGPGTKLTATGGCLGGAIVLNTPSGNIDTRAAMLSKPGGTTAAAVVRGGPITLTAGGALTVGPNSSIASQFTATAAGAFNYGADRIHLESAGNMLIQGLVQSLGGANFGTDVFGGQNECTGTSRAGKPATSTSCVELWVGGTLTVDGGDPSKPGNTINGSVLARSGQNGLVNATDPSWIDVHVNGNIVLKGKPTAVGTNSFLFDAQQNSANARGGTISVYSYRGKVTASGRTFAADGATTDGGTGGLVIVEAAGPVDYPPLPSGQFHAADLNSNVDLGDAMQFARGANDGVVGGAGKIHVRSWNGQVTGGPVAVLASGTVLSLPVGIVVLPLVGAPITLAISTPVTLGNSTYHGGQFVKSVDGTNVALPAGAPITLPGGIDATVAVDTVVTPPGGTIANPSLTTLAGGCTDRLTGAALVDPATSHQYPCDDRTGVIDGGGIGATELIVTLCVGWLYNGVTRPLAITNVHECGGRPTPPPDVVIPVAPTLQIFGGVYQYDGFERPARGTVGSGFVDIGGGHRVAAVVPQAYGQAGPTEPLLPLPTVTYVDSSNNPVTVPIEVGTYTATAYFPGNATYTPLTVTAPIIIFTQVPVVTVTGGIFRFDGQPHPATGVTTKDGSTQADIATPATVLYYNCVPNASQPSWNPATDASCTTSAPVQPTTTHLPPNVTLNDADAGHWTTVVAYFPGNSLYGPAWATARIAIWRPRPSVTTATGGTFVYDGNPHATTTTVADGGTDGLGATYPTQQNTVNLATWTFTDPVTGAVGTSGVTYDGTASPLHAVNVQAPVEVGSYPVQAVYPGDTMHSGSTGTNTIVITPRPVSMTMLAANASCDGNAHGATGSVSYTTTINRTGNTTRNSAIVTAIVGGTTGLQPGMVISGNGIAAGATILSVDSATQIHLSANATVTATNVALSITKSNDLGSPQFVYRDASGNALAGPPTTPGTYTVTASLPQSIAGNNAATPTIIVQSFTISGISASILAAGGTFSYDGQPHAATASVSNGQTGGTLSFTYRDSAGNLLSSLPVNIGAYTVTVTYTSPNACLVIAPVTTTITIQAGFCTPLSTGTFSFATLAYPASAVESTAYGINGAGEIVGAVVDDASSAVGGFWLSGPTGNFSPAISASALGAVSTTVSGNNGAGQIVGSYLDGTGQSHGFVLTGSAAGVGGTFTRIDVPGATQTTVSGISDEGVVVGSYVIASGVSRGFTLSGLVFPSSGPVDLSHAVFATVHASALGAVETAVYGVNDSGQVVGVYVDASGKERGFSAIAVGEDMADFTGATFTTVAAPGATATRAYGVNDVGQIVGSYDDAAGVTHGFSFASSTFTTLDVGALGTTAHGINNAGLIVGGYVSPTGDCGFVSIAGCRKVAIGPSTMEGSIKLSPGDWVSGGYSFKTNFPKAGSFTIAASVTIAGKCIGGTMTSDSVTIGLGTRTYAVPAGTTDWLPTGDAGSALSWMGAAQVPSTICGGGGAKLDGSKGAVFTANVSASPAQPFGTVSYRFKFRDPAAKGKPNTNCTDTSDPNRAKADVCGASWSATVSASSDCDKGGAFTTFTQGGWGAKPSGNNPGALLAANFSKVYPGGSVSIGVGNTLTFTSAAAIEAFLPQGGTAGVLTASATNPTACSAGVLAGQLLAAQLSLGFSNAGVTRSGFGGLTLMSGPLAGSTVAQVIALGNAVIGGNTAALPSGLTITGLNAILDTINNNFDNGTTNNGYLK
jgi:probable HAF family extracellular repeat protein